MLLTMKLITLRTVTFWFLVFHASAMAGAIFHHGESDEAVGSTVESQREGQSVRPIPIQAIQGQTAAKSKGKAGAVQTVEGTFLRIDEGDYAHWVMKTTQSKEVSFFVLKPDAGLEKVLKEPGKFTGKKCRVQWKSTTQHIPEAGGKMKVEEILSVEWLGKK